MDNRAHAVIKQFRSEPDKGTIRRFPDEIATAIKYKVHALYNEFKKARDGWQADQYELLMYDGNQRRPWEWLLGFLDGQSDVLVVPYRAHFDKTWFKPNNDISIEQGCTYWFANGAEAHQHFGTRQILNHYFLSNASYDWLIFYDESSNGLFFYGEEATKWAHNVEAGFYESLGLTYRDDIRLFNVGIEDWGYRLVLDCRYHYGGDEFSKYFSITLIFDDCHYLDWSPSINLQGKPYDKFQRIWMYLGQRNESGKMIVPAFLSSYALAIKFTYKEMVIVRP